MVQTFAPKVAGHVTISPANYQAMLAGFEGAVQNPKGTAVGGFAGFPLSTFPLAGKTGTATTNEQQPNSWFVGWGPLPDPQYLIAVVVEGGGFGASAAAPVAPGLRLPGGAPREPDPPGLTDVDGDAPSPASAADTAPGHGHRRPRPRPPRPRRPPPTGRALTGAPAPTSDGAGSRLDGHMTSLWPRIEPLLAQVTKPARYIGGELGACQPVHGPGRVAWLLLYPDTYEIGLPNQGLQILYEILNERADAVAERAYAPWTDMEAAMRARGGAAVLGGDQPGGRDFDVLAFNLSAELTYTNVLNLIDLAGVPVRGVDRSAVGPARDGRGPLRLQPRAAGRFRRRLRPR